MAEKTKYQRLFDLHRRFMFHGRLTIRTMMDDYGINRRTANRDINDLISLGVQLESDTLENGLKVWYLPASQRRITVPFNLTDVAALFLGRGLFGFCKGTLFEESLDKIFETIESQISREKDLIRLHHLKKKMHIVSDGPKHLTEGQVEELDEVLTGLFDDKKIRFDYTASNGTHATFTVVPYTLVTYKMGLYLLARPDTGDDAAIRIFAIERMSNAEAMRGTHFQLPANYSPDTHFRNALFIQKGSPTEVVLLFDATSKPFVAVRQFHASQKIETLADGTLRMTLSVPAGNDDFEILNWIVSFHKHVRVLSPASLANAVKDTLAAALSQYA
ncbi:MAG: WYL domain-containing transcriptional regulator [Deltaproteobacteria bacterium]|nr:WYL domain-containing transcriptional regulator [Deltaproteobacteria bacterium]